VPDALLAQIPLRRTGVPEDYSGACFFLASDEASYITGQTLLVNGGAIGFV
jgi:3-oxoacyl-[acyl-carrier protein] reductase